MAERGRWRRIGAGAVAAAVLAAGLGAVPAASPAAGGEPAVEAPDGALPDLPGGNLHPVVPHRILDTRDGTGGFDQPVGAARSIAVSVLGKGGVPTSGVTAVVLNVTATSPTAAAFVTVWPTGSARPTASNLNVMPGTTAPNLVQVKVGAGGKVSAFNSAGRTHLVMDVTGWIGAPGESGTAGLFQPVVPSRLLDTRDGTGATKAKVGPGRSITLTIAGRGGVPATGVGAVALNLTATEPSAATFVTAHPSGSARPLASNLNAVAGQTVPNRVVVKVGPNGKVVLYNHTGSVHLIADVGGWYTDGSDGDAIGGRFVGVQPVRVLDTRTAGGLMPNQGVVSPKIAGANGIPGAAAQIPATAVVANLTVTEPRGPGYLTAFPSQSPRPLASDVNFVAGQTVPNLIITKLGPDGRVSVFDALAGSGVHVIVDVLGYYAGDVVVADTAQILAPTDLAKLTGTVGSGTTTVTFDPAPNTLADVEVGDTLVGGISPKSPSGLLKEVVTKTETGTKLTLGVQNGSLSDVVLLGDLQADTTLDATTAAATDGVSAAAPAPGDISLSHALSLTLAAKIPPPPSTYALEVAGSVTLEAKASLETKYRCCFGVDVQADLSFSSELAATVTGSATWSGSETQPLAQIPFVPIPFAIGPIPVVVKPELDVSLKTTASISGSISGGLKKRSTISAGIKYSDGEFDPYADWTSDPAEWTGPDATIAGSVKAEIEPDVAMLLYGVAGPAFTPAPHAQVSVTSKNFDTCLDLKIEYGVAIKAKAKLEILGKTLGEYSATIKEVSSLVAAKSIGGCGGWVGQITISTHREGVDVDAVITRHADGTLTWSGSARFAESWGVCPGTPFGTTVVQYVGYHRNEDGTLEEDPVVDQPIPDLSGTTYPWFGSEYTVQGEPVAGPPHWGFGYEGPGPYWLKLWLPVEADWTAGSCSGRMIVDLADRYQCGLPAWPQGVATRLSPHVTGSASQPSYGETITWDLMWTGAGPPVNGPGPGGCGSA